MRPARPRRFAAAAPDAATLLRVEKLVARGRDLPARKDQPERALAEEAGRFAELRAQPQDILPEAETLREKLRAFGEIESLDVHMPRRFPRLRRRIASVDEKCARLSPALGDLDLFARSQSPDAAAIARTARVFEDFSAREATTRAKAQEAEAQIIAADTRLRTLELQGPGPSPWRRGTSSRWGRCGSPTTWIAPRS